MRLACPDCHSPDRLGTEELICGLALARFDRVDGEVVVDYEGETIVDWDTSETTGVGCRCGWTGREDELEEVPDAG